MDNVLITEEEPIDKATCSSRHFFSLPKTFIEHFCPQQYNVKSYKSKC